MHSELWMTGDIAAALRAISLTAALTGKRASDEYLEGFNACLFAVAIALNAMTPEAEEAIKKLGGVNVSIINRRT